MGVIGRKFKDKNGSRVIILHQLGKNSNNYALANLDDNSVSVDYNAKSLGIAVSQLTAEEWKVDDREFTPPEKEKATASPCSFKEGN